MAFDPFHDTARLLFVFIGTFCVAHSPLFRAFCRLPSDTPLCVLRRSILRVRTASNVARPTFPPSCSRRPRPSVTSCWRPCPMSTTSWRMCFWPIRHGGNHTVAPQQPLMLLRPTRYLFESRISNTCFPNIVNILHQRPLFSRPIIPLILLWPPGTVGGAAEGRHSPRDAVAQIRAADDGQRVQEQGHSGAVGSNEHALLIENEICFFQAW
jgi:hypothetical protein